MTIVAIARFDIGQIKTQSFQLWENDKLISSHVDNISELGYEFEADAARPTISFDGKYAAFSINNVSSPEYTRIARTMVLSDTGDFFEVGFDQTISESEISRKTSFTPDGYLYNYYSTQRCKIGDWTVEPSGLPKGEMTVDAANNILFIVSNNRSTNVTIRAFYIDSLIETDMPINLTDDITGSEAYYIDLAVSPTGNGIDVVVIPYEGYDSPPYYEPTKKIFFGLHSKSKWSAIQMFPHETRHGQAGAMSAFSTDGTILARYFSTRDGDKEFGTVTTINAMTGKFIGSSEIPNTIGMTSPAHKYSFAIPLTYPVQLDNTPIFYGQFPYQPSGDSAVFVNAIDIFTRELRPTSYYPMRDINYYTQLKGIAAQPKISTFQHRNNFWDRFVFTEETLD